MSQLVHQRSYSYSKTKIGKRTDYAEANEKDRKEKKLQHEGEVIE